MILRFIKSNDASSPLQVYVHQTLHTANQRSLKRGGRVMAITPRHFLDFINHFVKLYAEKRAALVKYCYI